MTAPLALVAFAVWTLLLVLGVVAWRSFLVLKGEKGVNDFPSGQWHGPPTYWRLYRAHQNAVENLVVFAALVLAGSLTGANAPDFDRLATVVVGARVVQTVLHVATTVSFFGYARFTAFLVQIGALLAMAWLVVGQVSMRGGT